MEAPADDQPGSEDGSSSSSGGARSTSPASSNKAKASPMHHLSSSGFGDEDKPEAAATTTSSAAAAHQPLPTSGSPSSSIKMAQQTPRVERAVSSDAETAILSETTPVAVGSSITRSTSSSGNNHIPLQTIVKFLCDVFRLWDVLSATNESGATDLEGPAANNGCTLESFEGSRGDMEMAPVADGGLRVEATHI